MTTAWKALVNRRTTTAGAHVIRRRIIASYRAEQLGEVIAFIHGELNQQEGLDVYNIQYPGSVASASATEPVEQVVARLGADVQRFILPIFRGHAHAIRIEHTTGSLEAEAPDFETLEAIHQRWTSYVGTEGRVTYGLRIEGRVARTSQISRLLHLTLQVVARSEQQATEVTLEKVSGPGAHPEALCSTFVVPAASLLCSDCNGYHAPGLAGEIQQELLRQAFGNCSLRFQFGHDRWELSLNLSRRTFSIEYDSAVIVKTKDVERLFVRLVEQDGSDAMGQDASHTTGSSTSV